MGKKRYAKDPLLYIDQPTIRTPEAPMQYDYVTPKQVKDVGNKESPIPIYNHNRNPLRKRNFFKEVEQVQTEQSTDHDNLKNESDEHGVNEQINTGKFKDMTIEDKVGYFVNMPSQVPRLRCQIKTEDRSYRGMITDYLESYVYIREGRRKSSTKVPFEEIQSIDLLGF